MTWGIIFTADVYIKISFKSIYMVSFHLNLLNDIPNSSQILLKVV